MAAGHARVVIASAVALLPRVSPPDAVMALSLDMAPATRSTRGKWPEPWLMPGSRTGPGRRARRVLHPRRRHRHLPGRRRPAGAHRARRRHHRNDSPLRARHAAVGEDNRTAQSGAAAGIVEAAPEPLRRRASDARCGSRYRCAESSPRVSFFDYLGITRRAVVVVSEPDEVRERIESSSRRSPRVTSPRALLQAVDDAHRRKWRPGL